MSKSYGLLLLCAVSIMGMGVKDVQAQASGTVMGQIGDIPQFTPSTGWNVQKTAFSKVRGLEQVNLPCMMAASYGNGFNVRLSGTQNNILAMAIDFRQNIFTRGRRYPSTLQVGNQPVGDIKGTAFSQSVLIFNMREFEGFYNQISSATSMTLNVEDNPMVFALGGIANGLTDLSSCASGKAVSPRTTSVQKAALPVASPTSSAPVFAPPSSLASASQVQKSIQGNVWEAKAGDSMKATLEGWASRAGVDLDWQATGPDNVTDDIRVTGSFEDAVQVLMARNAAALGFDSNIENFDGGHTGAQASRSIHRQVHRAVNHGRRISHPVDAGAGALRQVLAEPQVLSNPSYSASASQYSAQNNRPTRASSQSLGGGRWSAPVGTSLQQVLQSWSKREGVELVWQSNQGFSVKNSVSANGGYEQALESLLGQYTNEKIRPTAQLNNDPVTGRRVLFIQSSRVL